MHTHRRILSMLETSTHFLRSTLLEAHLRDTDNVCLQRGHGHLQHVCFFSAGHARRMTTTAMNHGQTSSLKEMLQKGAPLVEYGALAATVYVGQDSIKEMILSAKEIAQINTDSLKVLFYATSSALLIISLILSCPTYTVAASAPHQRRPLEYHLCQT